MAPSNAMDSNQIEENTVPESPADVKNMNASEFDAAKDGLRMKINGKWLWLSDVFIKGHPGGPVLTQYKDADATHIFHAFHEGSAMAYKQLAILEARGTPAIEDSYSHEQAQQSDQVDFDAAKVVAEYDLSLEKEKQIVREFEQLRQQVHAEGLMLPQPAFYVRKVGEVFGLLGLAFWLQYCTHYVLSAMVLALTWQQMGWLCHEFCHHQPSKNRRFNDALSLLLGNVCQGFSRDWWKDKHNLHHAATNIIERDGDIDLAPLLAMVPDHFGKCKTLLSKLLLRLIVPYQHWYFTAMYLLLRLSWTSQSILHSLSAKNSEFKKHRKLALAEQLTLAAHWFWVCLQLWLLPTASTRILYFAISQLGGGLLISLVVSYNHNSVPKFPQHTRLLNNFAALHLMTTRNMRPSTFVDWLWGGLNYQIEHHLFPTMPRPNLGRCSQLVRGFCARTGLPYMVDDFATGYMASLRLLRQVAEQAVLRAKSF